MPDNYYFRQPNTQNMLLDILFVWSKLNSGISYRQGMHEVLAPILWVVERDAIDPTSMGSSRERTKGKLVEDMFNAEFIAHDTFTLFSLVMQHVKSSYQVQAEVSSTALLPSTRSESPMVVRSRHLVETLLAKTDSALAAHLKSIDIIPQLFLMRWVRLLFGREFSFDQVLSMWDRLFAEDPSADCVDLICLAMILRIRWQLMDCDNNSALSLLLHYPEPSEDQPPYTFVDDALYLKKHLNPEGGHDLILKYSNRAPPLPSQPDTSATPATPSTPYRSFSPLSRPARLLRQSGGFDKMLQEAAREVYTRGEKWGLNQAVRDAVGEVRKNVEGLQRTNSQSHQSSNFHDHNETFSDQLLLRIDALNARNKSLAKMLEGAVTELWQRQKDEAEGKFAKEKNDESFTLAIAKVQLVQVYLEDSSLPLPSEETSKTSEAERSTEPVHMEENEVLFDQDTHPHSPTEPAADMAEDKATPSRADLKRPPQPSENATNTFSDLTSAAELETEKGNARAPSSTHAATPSNHANRPSLPHSSFSWILGQDKTSDDSPRAAFLRSTSPFTMPGQQQPTDRRAAARSSAAFLFGDVGEESPRGHLRKGSNGSKVKDKAKMWKDGGEADHDDVFKLGTLRLK